MNEFSTFRHNLKTELFDIGYNEVNTVSGLRLCAFDSYAPYGAVYTCKA